MSIIDRIVLLCPTASRWALILVMGLLAMLCVPSVGDNSEISATSGIEPKIEQLLPDENGSGLFSFAWLRIPEDSSKDYALFQMQRVDGENSTSWSVTFRSPMQHFPLPYRIYTHRGSVLLLTDYVSHVAISRYMMLWDSSGALQYSSHILGTPIIVPHPENDLFLLVNHHPRVKETKAECRWQIKTLYLDGSISESEVAMAKDSIFNTIIGICAPAAASLLPDGRLLFVGRSFSKPASAGENATHRAEIYSWVMDPKSGIVSHINRQPVDSVSTLRADLPIVDFGCAEIVSVPLPGSEIGFLVFSHGPSHDPSSQAPGIRADLVRYQYDGQVLREGMKDTLHEVLEESNLTDISKRVVSQESFSKESCTVVSIDLTKGFLVNTQAPKLYRK